MCMCDLINVQTGSHVGRSAQAAFITAWQQGCQSKAIPKQLTFDIVFNFSRSGLAQEGRRHEKDVNNGSRSKSLASLFRDSESPAAFLPYCPSLFDAPL